MTAGNVAIRYKNCGGHNVVTTELIDILVATVDNILIFRSARLFGLDAPVACTGKPNHGHQKQTYIQLPKRPQLLVDQ